MNNSRFFTTLGISVLCTALISCGNSSNDDDNSPPAQSNPEDNILINEVLSKSDIVDYDFIELFNNNNEDYTFEAGQWSVNDLKGRNEDLERGVAIPGGTVIPAKGFLLIITNEDTLPVGAPADAIIVGTDDDGFGLGKGDTALLIYNDEVVEEVNWLDDTHVDSWGRLPDGGDFTDLSSINSALYASPGVSNVARLTSVTLDFTAFNDQEDVLEANGLRIFGHDGADLSADVEPEYVTVSADSSTAWVSLQENNGLARVDISNQTITDIFPLGFKDYGATGNEIDASDKDGDTYNPQAWANVFGMYQPDGITSFEDGGVTYIVTANEGDAREYDGFEEEMRVEDVTLDTDVFADPSSLQAETALGRLQITQFLNSNSAPTEYEALYSFGARSFSLWNGDSGALVYDSGNDLATQANAAGVYPDGRSDAKGTEPENVAVGTVGSKRLAFIGLERADAVAVYDLSDLNAISFQQMLITEFDDAPEGILFVAASDSPSGSALLVVSNEDSGNITVYQGDNTGNFSFAGRLVLEGGEGAAEISAFDPTTNLLFVLNNGEDLTNPRIDVVDLSDPTSPSLSTSADVSLYGGGINSVSVANGLLAAAIEAEDKTQAGNVVVFDTQNLVVVGVAQVGSLPDMVTFTPDGTALITADEGEPNDDYSVDPLGTVSIITLP